MSAKCSSPDNAAVACEGFFSHLKTECFYGRDFSKYSINQFIEYLNDYIDWYKFKRIKRSLNYKTPIQYRKEMGYL